METMKLQATSRTTTGKRSSKDVRRKGSIPAVLYGHGMTPLSVEVNYREFDKALHTKAGENVLINLQVEGVKLKESTCLIKEIQHNPVTDEIAHIDFTVISLNEKIEVKVPVLVSHAEEAAGVKEGGVLDVVHHEIEIECLPTEIPEKFEIDVRAMKIGDAIHLKDLKIPKGITCKLDDEEVIVTLHPPAKEEEKPLEEGAVQPEVIEKGKKLEEGEEGEAPAKAAPAPAAEKAEKKEK